MCSSGEISQDRTNSEDADLVFAWQARDVTEEKFHVGWKCSRNLNINLSAEVKRSPQKMYICSHRAEIHEVQGPVLKIQMSRRKTLFVLPASAAGPWVQGGLSLLLCLYLLHKCWLFSSYMHEPHPSISQPTNNVRWVLQAVQPRFHCHKATNTSEVAPSADGTEENSKVPNTASKNALWHVPLPVLLYNSVFILLVITHLQ